MTHHPGRLAFTTIRMMYTLSIIVLMGADFHQQEGFASNCHQTSWAAP